MMKRILFSLILIVLLHSLFTLELTQEEENWIEAHPQIKLGISQTWKPFIIKKKDNTLEGIDVDFINEINKSTGLEIELIPGIWHEIIEQATTRQIDGLAESTSIEERKKHFLFTHSYNTQYYLIATTPDKLKELSDSKTLKNKRISYIRDNGWVNKIIKTIGLQNTIITNSEHESFNLVLEGKADASFLPLALYNDFQNIYYNNLVIARIFDEDEFKLNLVYSIRKDWPELVSILDKAIDEISEEKRNRIMKKWLRIYPKQSQELNSLLEEEKQWLKEHPVIRIAPAPNYPPLDFFDKFGNYKGISADYMKLIEDDLDIKFDVVRCKNWDEVLEKARNREIDLIPAAAQTPQREEYLNHTEPFLVYPGVYITRNDYNDIEDISDITNKKVAIVSGYVWEEFFNTNHQDIEIIKINTIKEGIREVSMGNIDVMIGTLPIILYYMKEEGIHNLKIAGETGYYIKSSILMRKDWPIFTNIIKKSLANISDKDKIEINNKWIYLHQKSLSENPKFWEILLLIAGISLGTILLILIWNYSLKKQVINRTEELKLDYEKRRHLENKLRENEEKYKLIIESHVDILVKFDVDGNLLYVSPSYCQTFGKNEEDLLGYKFMPLIHPDDRDKTNDILKQLYHKPHTCYIEQRAKTVEGWRWLAWKNKAILDNEGKIIEIIGLGRDITEQKNIQYELNKAAIEWQSTFDSSNDAILVMDKEYRILRWNKRTFSILHFNEQDLTGIHYWEIIHSDTKSQEEFASIKVDINLKREIKEIKMEDRWLEMIIDPILDENNQYSGGILFISDITARKCLEIELKKHKDNLEKLVQKRTSELEKKNEELEKMNQLFIGREFRIKTLRDNIVSLETELKNYKK